MLLVLRVVAQVINQVAPVDIEHGADGDEGAEADVFAQAPVENGGAEGAALAEEADGAGLGDGAGEGGVEAGLRHHDAQAVGADEAHLALARFRDDLPLELDARGAGFFEAGGNDDGALDAGGDAFCESGRER